MPFEIPSNRTVPCLRGCGKKQNRVFILELTSRFTSIFINATNLKEVIAKNFSSLKIIDLRLTEGIECRENDKCFYEEIADFASPENIKKLWENHSNALEEVLVARKDVNVPYEIIKLMEWFAFGLLGERVVEDNRISDKMCVRYPALGKEESEGRYPIQILVKTTRCQHAMNSPWMLFTGDY